MRKAILVFCIGCVLSALFLQTLLFQESLRRQIRFESITDNENTLTKMQSELSSFIHTIRSEMLTVYSERDLIEALRGAAAGEGKDALTAYYWRSWYLGRKRFTKEDRLLAMYLYDAEDALVSAYRYNCQTFSRNIYAAEYEANEDRVKEYVHSARNDLMISGYYPVCAEAA